MRIGHRRTAITETGCALFGAALWSLGCASAPKIKAPVAVMLLGDAAVADVTRRALSASELEDVEVRFVDLPKVSAPAGNSGDVESAVSAARSAYVSADVATCLASTGNKDLLSSLFMDGRRTQAARLLFWRVACRVVEGESREAEREASEFAALGLDVPPDADAASPEVERVIGNAMRTAASQKRVSVEVLSTVAVEVAVDGEPASCSTPCSVEVRPGSHFIGVFGDGLTSAVVRVTVPEQTKVSFSPVAASPAQAASQWKVKYGSGPAIESTPSIMLLAKSVAARNFALFVAEKGDLPKPLRGMLTASGGAPLRAERALLEPTSPAEQAMPLFLELLRNARVVETKPLYKNPWFWAVTVTAAGLATGITAGLLYERDVRTQVGF
ncbi:MAG: hypothetical protein IPK82_35470 [Polyangiaceae bacterium]|nr:hypothetical protein [Polyangiaceae bacterium]